MSPNQIQIIEDPNKVFWIKLVHSVLFLSMSVCVVYILYAGIAGDYNWPTYLVIGIIVVEGLVLAINKWQCPLTDLAKRYGDETGRVTDIFCPSWIVPHVFRIYGALFSIGVLVLLLRYFFR